MSRDVFQMTISNTDAADKLVALEGIQISVFARGTTNPVSIYQRPTGATQGPTPECGATGGPNPFTTGPSGGVEFWCEGPAELDIKIHDTIGPARVTDRTFGWNAMPAAAASIPGSIVAADGTLALTALGDDIKRQMAQLGQVIDWWRPASTVSIPVGWEICDGRTITGASHDFAGAGVTGQSITLPDLRNAFVIGANSAKADGAAAGTSVAGGGIAVQTDTAADGPGIRGTGGSNRHSLGAVESGVNGSGVVAAVGDHAHNVYDPGHAHSIADPTHAHSVGGGSLIYNANAGAAVNLAAGAGMYRTAMNADAAGTGIGIYAAATGISLYGAGTHAHTMTARAADSPHNNTPKFVGLLKLMKVRLS